MTHRITSYRSFAVAALSASTTLAASHVAAQGFPNLPSPLRDAIKQLETPSGERPKSGEAPAPAKPQLQARLAGKSAEQADGCGRLQAGILPYPPHLQEHQQISLREQLKAKTSEELMEFVEQRKKSMCSSGDSRTQSMVRLCFLSRPEVVSSDRIAIKNSVASQRCGETSAQDWIEYTANSRAVSGKARFDALSEMMQANAARAAKEAEYPTAATGAATSLGFKSINLNDPMDQIITDRRQFYCPDKTQKSPGANLSVVGSYRECRLPAYAARNHPVFDSIAGCPVDDVVLGFDESKLVYLVIKFSPAKSVGQKSYPSCAGAAGVVEALSKKYGLPKSTSRDNRQYLGEKVWKGERTSEMFMAPILPYSGHYELRMYYSDIITRVEQELAEAQKREKDAQDNRRLNQRRGDI